MTFDIFAWTYFFFTIFLSILLLIVASKRAYQQYKQKKILEGSNYEICSYDIVRSFLKSNNCSIIREHKMDDKEHYSVEFKFCSGHFNAILSKTSQQTVITLPGIYALEANADYITVLSAAVDRFSYSQTFVRAYTTFDEERNKCCVDLSYEAIDLTVGTLDGIMNLMMRSQFEFKKFVDEQIKNIDKTEENYQHKRELYLLYEAECQEYENHDLWKFNPEKRFTVGGIICNLFGAENIIKLESLTIYHSDKVNTINKATDIYDYDLIKAMYEDDTNDEHISPLTVKIKTDRSYYIIDLEPVSNTQFALHIRLTLICVPDEQNNDTDMVLPFGTSAGTTYLAVYDKTTEEKKQSEFHYMYIDAQDKINDGKENELTEEQKIIAHAQDPSYHLYFGAKMFYNARYADAIWYLEPIFNMAKATLTSWDDDDQSQFLELAYLLGFSYFQIRNYEMAIYYLYFTQISTDIRYATIFIDALVEAHDVRVFREIDNLLDNYNNKKQINDATAQFCEFLLRSRSRACITFNDLDTAENICNQLLDSQYSQEYAKKELERIKQLRTEQAENQ